MASITLRKVDDYVKVMVSHRTQRWKISTGIKVPDRYWKKDHLLQSHPNYKITNDAILAFYNQVMQASINVRNRGEIPTVHAIRAEYTRLQANDTSDIDSCDPTSEFQKEFVRFTESKKSLVKSVTLRAIRHTEKSMLRYMEFDGYFFTPHSFDQIQFGRFIQYLTFNYETRINNKGLHDSTIHNRVRWLRSFLKW
ncbi:MAG: hypothetical protein R6U04_06010, partial [Bacteroidales bacterium]